ncbi:hypothetical protein DFJ73DRAFT_968013 [Zopfochytrium polystomum]|nr:hypothetical protein DFJ73DRAFT_968013 [Zopfochytrium polystomum]
MMKVGDLLSVFPLALLLSKNRRQTEEECTTQPLSSTLRFVTETEGEGAKVASSPTALKDRVLRVATRCAAADPAVHLAPALDAILAHFPETRYLETYFGDENYSIWGSASLDTVASRCPHLTYLNTRGTGGYAPTDIDRFMTRMPHLVSLAIELSDDDACAAWAADEIADAPWWARFEKLLVGPNREVGFEYTAEQVVAIVSRARGVRTLNVDVDADCVVAVAEAALRVAHASVESICFNGVRLADESARKAVELVLANKPRLLKEFLCDDDDVNVTEVEEPEYQKIVAMAVSAGVSLVYTSEDGQGPPEVVIEKL